MSTKIHCDGPDCEELIPEDILDQSKWMTMTRRSIRLGSYALTVHFHDWKCVMRYAEDQLSPLKPLDDVPYDQ